MNLMDQGVLDLEIVINSLENLKNINKVAQDN